MYSRTGWNVFKTLCKSKQKYECVERPESGSRGGPKFTEDVLVRSYSSDKIFMKIRSVFRDISAKLLQNALSRNVKKSFNRVLDPDPWADEFQNVISSSRTGAYLGVKFGEDRCWFVTCVAGQTNRQINATDQLVEIFISDGSGLRIRSLDSDESEM